MKSKIAAVLIVAVLFAGVATGFFSSTFLTARTDTHITTQSSGQVSCETAPQGSILYVKIAHDVTKTPVTNATVDATPVETCNGIDTTIAILMEPAVNSTGVATIDAGYYTSFSITVHYGTQVYPFAADVQSLITCATISIPSGSLGISAC